MTMSHQIETIYKEVETIKKHKMGILVLKNTITKMKLSLEEINSIFKLAEELVKVKIDQ